MSVIANLPDQLDVLRRENTHLEADNLAIRGLLAEALDDRDRARRIAVAFEQHIAEAAQRLQEAADNLDEPFDLELDEAIHFLRGEVTGQ